MSIALRNIVGACLIAAATIMPVKADEKFTTLTAGADPHFRPISFLDESGKIIGFDVDFVEALGKQLGIETKYEGMAWDGIIPALQAKKIDAITNMVITDERKKVVNFSDPIMQQAIIAVVKSDADKKDVTLDDLKTLRTGVMVSTSAAGVVEAVEGANVTTYNTVVDAYNDLMLGRIDTVVVESVNGSYIVATQFSGKLEVVEKPLTADVKLNGVALRQSDVEGLKQVNEAIAAMKADGTLNAIAVKWFGNASSIPQ
jgi:ABC-type amino acid transport substrate-binding protein